jgi:hypothetical protein
MKYNTDKDELVFASDKPNVTYLIKEYRRSIEDGDFANSIERVDDIRLARWEGQTEDGKKHSENRPEGDPAFPFEGASDVRSRLIDRTINDIVSMLMTTFDRCKVNVNGTEFNDYEVASTSNILMGWLLQRFRPDIRREAELLAQYTHTYGWSALNIIWEQEQSVRLQRIRMDEILMIVQQIAQQDPQNPIVELPQAIMDVEKEDFAVTLLNMYMPTLKPKRVKKALKSLREKGEAFIPEPYISKNFPKFVALKPYDEIGFPPETIDIQNARVIFRRLFMTEVELRAKAAQEEWTKTFVDEAVKTAGSQQNLYDPNLNPVAELMGTYVERSENLIEIVYAYNRAVDEDGAVGIYQTIFCPNAGEGVYAKHELTGFAHNKYPFVIYSRERIRRAIYESRGIPQVAMTDQEEIKAQHDAFRDRTALTTMPPVLMRKRNMGINKIAPGVSIPVTTPDEMKFMDPPRGDPSSAFLLIQTVEQNHASYFGQYHPNIPLPKTQTAQQFMVNNWLDVWSEAFAMSFSMMLQYMAPEEIEGITGKAIPQNLSNISNMYDFQVKYDVRELDTTFVIEKLKAITQFVLPLDNAGVIDRTKLVKAAIEAIDPDKAKDLIINTGTASQLLYKNVQSDLGLMMLGNEAQYVENDPSAEAKMQYLQDIMSKNPKAQQYMQGDQHFRALLDNYVKNLQMSISQQQNKQIGRTGVTPVGEQAASGMQSEIEQAEEAQKQSEQQMQ